MSVVIRLSKTGKTHAISYRIVATEKWSKRDGRNIEILGFYNPWQREGDRYQVDKTRYDYWVSKGAKPSPTVAELVETNGNPKPKPKKERPKKEAAGTPPPTTPVQPATQPAEAPKQEQAATEPEVPTKAPVEAAVATTAQKPEEKTAEAVGDVPKTETPADQEQKASETK